MPNNISDKIHSFKHFLNKKALLVAVKVFQKLMKEKELTYGLAIISAANEAGVRPKDLQRYIENNDYENNMLPEDFDLDECDTSYETGIDIYRASRKPRNKVRYTGKYADNAIDDYNTLTEDGCDLSMVKKLNNILNDAGVDNDEIMQGINMSNLGKQKIAAKMGTSAKGVSTLYNSLRKYLRDQEKKFDDNYGELIESNETFSFEEDYLGNVKIRNNETSEEKLITGSDGFHLLNQLDSATTEEKQKILSEYFLLNEAVEHNIEYDSDFSSYNFPWKIGDNFGTGTASYTGYGDDFSVHVIDYRDNEGNRFEPSPSMASEIKKQAIDFIGYE